MARSYGIVCRRPPCGRFLFAGMARSFQSTLAHKEAVTQRIAFV
jgi:hypothetical protein